jgi:transposase
MLALSGHNRFYLYAEAIPPWRDKSFDGLCGLVTSALSRNPASGEVYVFVNRRRDRMKLLVWDRSGFWIFYKRLEQGTFQLPATTTPELPYETLLMMLEGIDLAAARRRRYQRSSASPA